MFRGTALTEGFYAEYSILWNLAAFIIALGVLITVHGGHFWVAARYLCELSAFPSVLAKRSGVVPIGTAPVSSPDPAGRLRQKYAG